ncbi:PP2C family protein-serine/threonine phosphatase [Anaerobaca lacustris]|uniref:Protein phosphatase 2C domain-containing protein n=1 Tax=Anaerobaca lacustris TaxID=3044600 RepID=A0AAW6U678_9BACT|nr:protein phosphatase 2C domain-containing protein [Sedimentisphaerales bacterium M17dextr]
MTLRFSHRIIAGPRDNIEDNLGLARISLPIHNQTATVAVIADGVRGEEGGEVASAMAVKTLIAGIVTSLSALAGAFEAALPTPEEIDTLLAHAMTAANRAVLGQAAADPHLKHMATTAVCVLAVGDTLHVAWVGDSRAYLYTQGELRRLTRDHTETQRLIDAGCLDPARALWHPRAHRITRCVGQTEGFQPDLTTHRLSPGDIVLLATDGLTDVLGDHKIGQILHMTADDRLSMDEAARQLVKAALLACTSDNTSVLLFEPIPVAPGLERTRTGAFPPAFFRTRQPHEEGAKL